MSPNYSRQSSRLGLTLVEVIVSLALLSTLLVGMVCAHDRHARQIRNAEEMLRIVRRVDRMLYGWMETDRAIPREAAGVLADEKGLVWKTRLLTSGASKNLQIDVVRLEIGRQADRLLEHPVLTIDLAVPASSLPAEEK